METHPIDSIIKKAISESENFYNTEANNAKDRIWNQVQLRKQSQPKPLLFRLLAAACILLFISTSLIAISYIKDRNTINTLVELNNSLKNKVAINNKKEIINKKTIISSNFNASDTVYVEKKVIVNNTVISSKQITDTVYIKQIVYVEKEPAPAILTTTEKSGSTDAIGQKSTSNFEAEILINNNESVKKEKKNKIQIKFGGNKNQINSGNLAFNKEF